MVLIKPKCLSRMNLAPLEALLLNKLLIFTSTKALTSNTTANGINCFKFMTDTVITVSYTMSHKGCFHSERNKTCHFFANVIFMAFVGVILKPCSASFAAVD